MGARVTRCSGNATGAQRGAYSRVCGASTAFRPVAVGVGGAERDPGRAQRDLLGSGPASRVVGAACFASRSTQDALAGRRSVSTSGWLGDRTHSSVTPSPSPLPPGEREIRSESLQLTCLLPETLRQLLRIAFLLRIATHRLFLIGFLLPGKGPGSRHLQSRLEVARRNDQGAVDPGEVADLVVRRDDRAGRAIFLRQPLHYSVGLFARFGIDDLETLAPFGPLDRMPGPPAVKDDRHGMALAVAIARQVSYQLLPLGFHVAPQTPSHPKQVVAVDDEMDRHKPSV